MTITGPTWVYHRTLPARIVATQDDYDALGEGWADAPAAVVAPSVPVTPERATRRRAKEQASV